MNIFQQIHYSLRRFRVANMIERNPDHFNMAAFFDSNISTTQDDWEKHQAKITAMPFGEAIHICGTTACIAGWATVVAKPNEPYNNLDPEGVALDFMGMNYSDAGNMFYKYSANTIRAAQCLRNYAYTNEVDWDAEVTGIRLLIARALGAIYIW